MSPKVSFLCLLLLQLLNAAFGDVSHLEYTITPSSQVAYYHYPAPRQQLPQRVQQQQQQRYQPPQQQYQQLARQFAAPHLEHAAFTQALTSQGYVFGAPSAPLPAVQAAPQPPQQSQPLKAPKPAPLAAATGRSIAGGVASVSASTDANSLNLKLPVPFGLAPLNVAQLPLQAGAPYASVPHTTGLTSYGTPQIQRR
ncbi:myb-like protein AA [Drosophila pseudoobscura]|uniref:Myb-like protein AA n=1 Tax=Drosophila pseudoobscura pseudoobscura TaxID=46245 RepID=A0A6I8UAT0_DROPS|nr:myb-like protein AA [Drosophila pseudoobscura]